MGSAVLATSPRARRSLAVVGGSRHVEILGYLAAHRNREIPQDELADVLWPKNRPSPGTPR